MVVAEVVPTSSHANLTSPSSNSTCTRGFSTPSITPTQKISNHTTLTPRSSSPSQHHVSFNSKPHVISASKLVRESSPRKATKKISQTKTCNEETSNVLSPKFGNPSFRSRHHDRHSPVCTMNPIDEDECIEETEETPHQKQSSEKNLASRETSIILSHLTAVNARDKNRSKPQKKCTSVSNVGVRGGKTSPKNFINANISPSIRRYARLQRSISSTSNIDPGSPRHTISRYRTPSPYSSPVLTPRPRRCSSSCSNRPSSRTSSIPSPCSSANSTPKTARSIRLCERVGFPISPIPSTGWRSSLSPIPGMNPLGRGFFDMCCGSFRR